MWGRLVVGVVVGSVVAWCADPGRPLQAATAPVCGPDVSCVAGSALARATAAHRHTKSPKVICGPERATTLAQDRVARIYQKEHAAYGCVRGGGHPIKLAQTDAHDFISLVALAGPVASYAYQVLGVDTSSTTLRVLRLTDDDLMSDLSTGYVTSLVVKRDGAVAWIEVDSGGNFSHGPSSTFVSRARGDSTELLDHSPPRIKAKSLKLDGSRLTWKRNNGTTGSATLP